MTYDVAIIGAGPAGATCALALRGAGLRVALLDKHSFPRDKVCGDAIPALCGKVLQQIDPVFRQALDQFPRKVDIASCRVVAPGGHHFEYSFTVPGWCSPRLDFDQFLLDLALNASSIDFLPASPVQAIEGQAGEWRIQHPGGTLDARLIVGADGANGIAAHALGGLRLSHAHHCAAVRAYYANVGGLQENRMEIHLLRAYLPGYFWIFPVGGGRANVGFGMMRKDIAARKLSLRQMLPRILADTPTLAGRFAGSVAESPVQGFGLPLGARRIPISGAGYLLAGDAASLVEPATGEGIGNAMYSGMVAAEVARAALASGRLDAQTLHAHDQRVYARLWKGMRQKHLAQQAIAGRPFILDTFISLAGKPGPVRWLMRKVF